MSDERQQEELSQEEMDSLLGEELPQREALSVLRIPFLGSAPAEPEELDLPET